MRHDRDGSVPEGGAEWVTRAEVRAMLRVDEIELREILRGCPLSQRWVPLYEKSEAEALRTLADRTYRKTEEEKARVTRRG